MKIFYRLFLLTFFLSSAYGQIGIGTTTPNAKSILDITSTNKGLLIPRMTTTERNAIAPTTGGDKSLLIYNTDVDSFQYWDGTQWVNILAGTAVAGSDGDWQIDGGNNYIYNTTDRIGIGTAAPGAPLHVSATDTAAIFQNSVNNRKIVILGNGEIEAPLATLHLNRGVNTNVTLAAGGGSVGIGTISPNAKSILDITSTNKGLLIPRMTTTQRNAIAPTAGERSLLIYNTTVDSFQYWDGTQWVNILAGTAVAGSDSDWQIDGGNNYVYNTTDDVGIGTAAPSARLHIFNNSTQKDTSLYIEHAFSGMADNYGIYQNNTASGMGEKYGFYNAMNNTGSGEQYGVYNDLEASGNQYGVYNDLEASGVGVKYGVFNRIIIPSGATVQASGSYTEINNAGTGDVYAYRAALSGAGTGTKYGVYMLGEDVNYFSNTVGIGTTTPNASALLEVSATDKGILIPRVALTGTTDNTTVPSPANSLLIYNTATAGASPNDVTPGFYYWDGSKWARVYDDNTTLAPDGDWTVDVPNSVTYLTNSGYSVGIGTPAPANKLHVEGGAITVQRETASAGVYSNTYGGYSLIALNNAGGTIASPSATSSGQILGRVTFGGRDGAGLFQTGAFVEAAAADNFNTTWASELRFYTAPDTGASLPAAPEERVRITKDGNVGVGTQTPLTRLHVKGGKGGAIPLDSGVLIDEDVNNNPRIELSANNVTYDPYIDFTYKGVDLAGRIIYYDNTYMSIQAPRLNLSGVGGNVGVGIGVSDFPPQDLLHLQGGTLRIEDASTNWYSLPASPGTNGQVLVSNGANAQMTWADPTTLSDGDWDVVGNNMHSVPTGSVGIGTTNTQAKLHITNASSTIDTSLFIQHQYSGSFQNYGIYVDVTTTNNGPQYGVYNNMNNTGIGSRFGVYNILTQSDNTQSNYLYGTYNVLNHSGTGELYGYYAQLSGPNATKYGVYMTGEDRNYFSGFVGIGLDTPDRQLHIVGNNTIGSGVVRIEREGGSARTTLRTYSNTPTNRSLLTLMRSRGTMGTPANVLPGDRIGAIRFLQQGGTGLSSIRAVAASTTASNLIFATGGNDRMIITDAGNIGIGTTTPEASALLDVSATDKGILIPRVALTGTNDNTTISSPANSLLIYNTANAGDVTPGFYYWDGSKWARVWDDNTTLAPDGDWDVITDTLRASGDSKYVMISNDAAITQDGARLHVYTDSPSDSIGIISSVEGAYTTSSVVGVMGFAVGGNDFTIGVNGAAEGTLGQLDTLVGVRGAVENVQSVGAGLVGEASGTANGINISGVHAIANGADGGTGQYITGYSADVLGNAGQNDTLNGVGNNLEGGSVMIGYQTNIAGGTVSGQELIGGTYSIEGNTGDFVQGQNVYINTTSEVADAVGFNTFIDRARVGIGFNAFVQSDSTVTGDLLRGAALDVNDISASPNAQVIGVEVNVSGGAGKTYSGIFSGGPLWAKDSLYVGLDKDVYNSGNDVFRVFLNPSEEVRLVNLEQDPYAITSTDSIVLINGEFGLKWASVADVLSASGGPPKWTIGGDNLGGSVGILGSTDNSDIDFITNNTTVMTLTASQQIGIGTLPGTANKVEIFNSTLGNSLYVDHSTSINSPNNSIGIQVRASNGGSGDLFGIHSRVMGTGTGVRRGLSTTVNLPASGGANSYGVGVLLQGGNVVYSGDVHGSNVLTTSTMNTSGRLYGYRADLTQGTAAGSKYGVYISGEDANYFSNAVGIGTSPSYPLHVKTTAGELQVMLEAPDSPTGYLETVFSDPVWKWSVGATANGNSPSNAFYIYQYNDAAGAPVNTYRLVVDDAGKVGIGTYMPATQLHIIGNNSVGSGIIKLERDGANAIAQLNSYSDITGEGSYLEFVRNEGSLGTPANVTAGDNIGAIRFLQRDGGSYTLSASIDAIAVSQSASDLRFITSGAERVRITSVGNVGIGTNNPMDKLHVKGGTLRIENSAGTSWYALPLTDGTNGQVLQTNGSGIVSWVSPGNYGWSLTGNSGTNPASNFLGTTDNQPLVIKTNDTEAMRIAPNGNVGIGTTTPVTRLHLDNDGAILARGAFNSGWTETNLGAGTRLLWYPRKAAFRAGEVGGNQWNDANIGAYSVAMGLNPIASGYYSVAMGGNVTASGMYSVAMGGNVTASGDNAVAMGSSSSASGLASIATGGNTTASGSYSSASGFGTTADAYASFVIGNYNEGGGSPTSWVPSDPIFEIGIGSDAANKKNAVTVLKNGNIGIGIATPGAKLEVYENVNSKTYSTSPPTAAIHNESGYADLEIMGATSETQLFLGRVNGTLSTPTNLVNGDIVASIDFGSVITGTKTTTAAINALAESNYGTTNATALSFYTTDNAGVLGERVRITSTGNLIPAVDNAYNLGGAGNRWLEVFASNGTINTSDRRLKKNIKPLTYGLETVMQMKPVTYQWKNAVGEQKPKLGFIAQDLMKVLPEVVNIGNDAQKTLGVFYSDIIPVLTKAIQEQQKQIEKLQAENKRLKDMEARLMKIEAQNQEIQQLKAEVEELKTLLRQVTSKE